ncbi:MAG: hypothetical protein LBK66_07625 [Spirochaetaceae bacterium]|nr:hypothetical protein [Spirochaetaceae bacterium]
MKKIAVIAALILLAAGIAAVYTQTVSGDRRIGERQAPLTLNESARRGAYGNGNGFNGGGGFRCH